LGKVALLPLALVAALLASGTATVAQTPTSIGHADTLAVNAVPTPAPLRVTSTAFADGGDLPLDKTQYGANRFPGLAWSSGPSSTRSNVVVFQGVLGATRSTSVHFLAYNISAGASGLPAGMTSLPSGAAYGANVHGAKQPYSGSHPKGSAKQDYHFQVFALDTVLPADPTADLPSLVAAMRGHVLAAGSVVARSSKPTATQPASVRIDSGAVQGAAGRQATVAVYRGIPFAAPPVGELRFRPPAPVTAWPDVRDASRAGPVCPQPEGPGTRGFSVSEDCLNLNIWTVAKPGEKLPVFVRTYGGGFLHGTGAAPQFDGEGLGKKGVVVVTFNYRTGALGFLSTPELSRESEQNASGNYGLLDDIALLKWVRRNIAAFGGDPRGRPQRCHCACRHCLPRSRHKAHRVWHRPRSKSAGRALQPRRPARASRAGSKRSAWTFVPFCPT
jgi:para-nitrobenzyl esterase